MTLKNIQLSAILAFILILPDLADETVTLTDWGRIPADAHAGLYYVHEYPARPLPALSAEHANEAEAYSAYLQALYLIELEQKDTAVSNEGQIIPLLMKAIDLFPEEEIYVIAFNTYRNARGENAELLEDLKALLERHPDSLVLNQDFAATLIDCKKPDEALQALQHAMDIAQDDTMNLYMLGNIYFEQKDAPRLNEVIAKLLALPPEEISPEIALLLMKSYAWQGEIPKALEMAERVVNHPESYDSLRILYHILPALTGMHAWGFLRTYTARFEQLHAAKLPFAPREMLCKWRTTANIYLNDYHELASYLEELLARPDCSAKLLEAFCAPIHEAFNQELAADDFQRLLEIITRAYEAMTHHSPLNPDYRRQLVVLYAAQNAPQKALAMLGTLGTLEPTDLLLKAKLLAQAKNYTESLKIYADFEKSYKNRRFRTAEFYLRYGCIAEENGETERSIKILRQGMKLYPKDASLANSLGYILADHQQDLNDAKRLIDFAIQQEPENPAYLDSLAWILYRNGEIHEALLAMTKALEALGPTLVPDLDQEMQDHFREILQAAGYTTFANCFTNLEIIR